MASFDRRHAGSTTLIPCDPLPGEHSRHILTCVVALLAFCFAVGRPAAAFADPSEAARVLVRASVDAMGGEDRLRDVHTVLLKGIGHRSMLEQSERPEGPWLLDYFQITEQRDLDRRRLRQERQSRGCASTECWKSPEWAPSTFIVADQVAAIVTGGKLLAGRATTAQDAEESLALAPERVLLLALAATNLHTEPDIQFHGFTHHVVSFTWKSMPIRIFLNGYTAMPSAVEITRERPYDFFWSPWGDVTTRVTYAFWMLEPGGLHYPHEWSYEFNGQPDWVFTINELTLNPRLKEEDFVVPEDIAKTFAERRRPVEDLPFGLASAAPKEVAPGIVQVPGLWNVEEVRQTDGLVILEGPISNGYSSRVIEDAQKRFPGVPIKAVVSTSDAWPHIGGLREYAARGIPIYVLDLNRPIVERLLAAPHHLHPDTFALHPRSPKLIYVSKRMTLGQGANRLDLIPLRTLTGERQLAVYFPGHKLLYSSDLFQREQSGAFFLPQTISEAVEVVRREGIEVHTDLGMHLSPTPWKDIEAAVEAQVRAASPSAR